MYFELEFRDPTPLNTGGSAWVAVEQHPREHDGVLRITVECNSADLDAQIDRMINELEAIRKGGRAKFAAATKKPRPPL
jgi:hypothetical protein